MILSNRAGHLFFLCLFLLTLPALSQLWCGHHYAPQLHTPEIFDTTPEQPKETSVFNVQAGYQPYTWETDGTLIASWEFQSLTGDQSLNFVAEYDSINLVSVSVDLNSQPNRTAFEFYLDLLPMNQTVYVNCQLIFENGTVFAETNASVSRYPSKTNEVKIDNWSRGLLVSNKSYFPMGFYLDWYDADYFTKQMDQEVTYAFNTPLPYVTTSVTPQYLKFMDHMADIGMHVHFDMYALAEEPSSQQKFENITDYVNAIKDHPALLAYYIADEPDGSGTGLEPSLLVEVYQLIKSLDPYHPVTIVLNCWKNPYHSIEAYSEACDVIMSDPYCIAVRQPVGCDLCQGNPTDVANRTTHFLKAVSYQKPFWIVAQAFGGSEHWSRQPDAREERTMTYLAILRGATGVQYFLEGIPYESLWTECHQLALEVADLTPSILGPNVDRVPVSIKSAEGGAIEAGAWSEARKIDGEDYKVFTVLVSNPGHSPCSYRLYLDDLQGYTGVASVLYETRCVNVSEGSFQDVVDVLATRAYRVFLPVNGKGIETGYQICYNASANASMDGNLIYNPSFEIAHNGAVPDSFQVHYQNAQGGSVLLDSRVAYTGYRSLRLITADEETPVRFNTYPTKMLGSYKVSIWALIDPNYSCSETPCQQPLLVKMEGCDPPVCSGSFNLTSDSWTKLEITCNVSPDLQECPVTITLQSKGTAWFDWMTMFQTN